MEEVKLLSFWASAFGKRVELALKAKGIPFQYVEENLRNKSELLLTSNPVHKKVPVLIHKGKPICESRFIIQYIDEAWPASPRLLPEDPYDRYLVLFWSDFMDKKSAEVRSQLFTAKLKSAEEKVSVMKKIQEEYAQTRITIEDGLAVLEERGLLYDGKTLKYMDVFFAPSMAWFGPTQKLLGLKMPESDKCPCLHRWMQNLQTNEVVKSTLPDADKLMEHGQASWI